MANPPQHRRRLQLTLRWKIMLTVAVVAFGVLTVAAVHSYQVNQQVSRSEMLARQYARFDAYREAIGHQHAATVAFAAADPELVATMTGADPAPRTAAAERIVRTLGSVLEADFVLIVDADGAEVAHRGDEARAVSGERSRILADVVRNTMRLEGDLALLDDVPFEITASPIRGGDNRVVGGLIVGDRLQRFFDHYRATSDTKPEKQVRAAWLDQRGRVLATAFPDEKRSSLAKALVRSPRVKVEEADNEVEVIDLDGEHFYFHVARAEGYRGTQHGEIGQLYLLRARTDQQNEFVERVRSSIMLYALVGIAALLVGFVLSTQITRRIDRYVKATEDLARGRGDLTHRLSVAGEDELGRLAENLNAVFAHTHDLAVKVSRAAFQVGASSAEISAASKQMLEGAQEQARKTESSTAAVTELSASIQQVAENALEATRVARSSGQAVEGAIGRMHEIRATVDEAASRMKDLGESGKRIGNIVEVIRQISDQTTLLALNAAIEAAHAGEQGRGFAVVADEVSSLAKRVGQSARDIEDLIATIKEQTLEAMRAMEAGTREVEAGTNLVTNTLADLRTLVQVVEDTAKAVQEQAVASDEIARNMDVVQRIAADVLSSSEEAVEQGDHLHRLAHGLEESVKGFKIDAAASRGGQDPEDGERPMLTSGEPVRAGR